MANLFSSFRPVLAHYQAIKTLFRLPLYLSKLLSISVIITVFAHEFFCLPTLKAEGFVLFKAVCPAPHGNIDETNLQCLSPAHCFIPGPGGTQTSVYPPEAIIPRGGSMSVNCSTSCDNYTLFGLETQLNKLEVNHGDNWKAYELSDIQENSSPICFTNCVTGGQSTASVSVTVFCEWLGPEAGSGRLPGGGGQWGSLAGWDSLCCLVVGPGRVSLEARWAQLQRNPIVI